MLTSLNFITWTSSRNIVGLENRTWESVGRAYIWVGNWFKSVKWCLIMPPLRHLTALRRNASCECIAEQFHTATNTAISCRNIIKTSTFSGWLQSGLLLVVVAAAAATAIVVLSFSANTVIRRYNIIQNDIAGGHQRSHRAHRAGGRDNGRQGKQVHLTAPGPWNKGAKGSIVVRHRNYRFRIVV